MNWSPLWIKGNKGDVGEDDGKAANDRYLLSTDKNTLTVFCRKAGKVNAGKSIEVTQS